MQDQEWICVISNFRSEINEICPLLEYYAAYSGHSLPTFLLIFSPWISWRLKMGLIGCPEIILFFSGIIWRLKMGPIGCPETSVRNYHYMLRHILQQRRF